MEPLGVLGVGGKRNNNTEQRRKKEEKQIMDAPES
jgi:hypothetical protein